MVLVSASPVLISLAYPGILLPQPGGGNTLELNATTGSVASIQDGKMGSAPKGSAGPNELCWVDGGLLIFRPADGLTYKFSFTPDGVITNL